MNKFVWKSGTSHGRIIWTHPPLKRLLNEPRLRSSRPEELPLQPLTERYVNLSIHTALVKQTRPLFWMPNEKITWVYHQITSGDSVMPSLINHAVYTQRQ